MELAEAIKCRIPLQVRLPDLSYPLETVPHVAAEVFLAETACGPSVIWIDPFWCEEAGGCHITYADPRPDPKGPRWVDQQPRYGPGCIANQKPVVIERVDPTSCVWDVYQAWKGWQTQRGDACGRRAAWRRVKQCYGDHILARRA